MLGAFLLVFVGASGMGHDVSVSTRFGIVMAVAAAVSALGAVIAAVVPVFPRIEPLPFVTGLALLPLPTLGGHSLDQGRPLLEPAVDFLHVAAASFWLGGLVALGLALRGSDDHAPMLRRFSNVALVSVALLATTGVTRAFAELSSLGQVWSTGYGRVLIVKTALLSALVGIGWRNRYRLLPRLSVDGLRRSVALELALFAALVAAVALLTDLRPGRDRVARAAVVEAKGPPPAPATNMWVQARETGTFGVALAVRRPDAEVFVLGQDNLGVNGLAVNVAGVPAGSCGASNPRRVGQGCRGGTHPARVHGARPMVDEGPGRERSLARSGGPWRAGTPSWSEVQKAKRVWSGARAEGPAPGDATGGEAAPLPR